MQITEIWDDKTCSIRICEMSAFSPDGVYVLSGERSTLCAESAYLLSFAVLAVWWQQAYDHIAQPQAALNKTSHMPHSWQLPTCSEPTTSSNLLKRDFEGQHQVAESVFFCDSCTMPPFSFWNSPTRSSSVYRFSDRAAFFLSPAITAIQHGLLLQLHRRTLTPESSSHLKRSSGSQRNTVLHPAVAFLLKLNLLHFSSAAFQMNLASVLLLSSPCFYNRCTLLFNVHRE